MEEHFLKLVSQLGLLAVIGWVVAASLGRRSQATIKAQPSYMDPGSTVWNRSGVEAPSASSGLLLSAGLVY